MCAYMVLRESINQSLNTSTFTLCPTFDNEESHSLELPPHYANAYTATSCTRIYSLAAAVITIASLNFLYTKPSDWKPLGVQLENRANSIAI